MREEIGYNNRQTQENGGENMGLRERYYQNACRPKGLGGRRFIRRMNRHHAALAEWALGHVRLPAAARGLDAGCGGGVHTARLLELCPQGHICGLDYAETSVRMSRRQNAAAIRAGRCEIVQGSVEAIPWEADRFDFVTAFETVYYWPGPLSSFGEVYRVLRPGGLFLICNEDADPGAAPWPDLIRGMTIYTDETLQSLLRKAGFRQVESVSDPKNGWLTVMCRK